MMKKLLYYLCVISLLMSFFFSCNIMIRAETTTSIIWSVTLYCNESGGTSDMVKFGEAPDANDGSPPDSYDIAKPPAPITPYVRIWLEDNLPSPYDLLWEDYRHYPDTEKVWNVTVQWMPPNGSSAVHVTIHWSIDEVDSSEYTSVTLCNETGIPLKNMLLDNTYSFSCSAYIPQYFNIVCDVTNLPPATPQKPLGETSGKTGVEYSYNTTTT